MGTLRTDQEYINAIRAYAAARQNMDEDYFIRQAKLMRPAFRPVVSVDDEIDRLYYAWQKLRPFYAAIPVKREGIGSYWPKDVDLIDDWMERYDDGAPSYSVMIGQKDDLYIAWNPKLAKRFPISFIDFVHYSLYSTFILKNEQADKPEFLGGAE